MQSYAKNPHRERREEKDCSTFASRSIAIISNLSHLSSSLLLQFRRDGTIVFAQNPWYSRSHRIGFILTGPDEWETPFQFRAASLVVLHLLLSQVYKCIIHRSYCIRRYRRFIIVNSLNDRILLLPAILKSVKSTVKKKKKRTMHVYVVGIEL